MAYYIIIVQDIQVKISIGLGSSTTDAKCEPLHLNSCKMLIFVSHFIYQIKSHKLNLADRCTNFLIFLHSNYLNKILPFNPSLIFAMLSRGYFIFFILFT